MTGYSFLPPVKQIKNMKTFILNGFYSEINTAVATFSSMVKTVYKSVDRVITYNTNTTYYTNKFFWGFRYYHNRAIVKLLIYVKRKVKKLKSANVV